MEPILQQYGLAGVVIGALAGAVVFLYKKGESLQRKYDALYEQRLQDLKDANAKSYENLQQVTNLSEKMNDIFISHIDKRRK